MSHLRGKKLHRNLVSISDSSFVYIRGTGAAIVYKKEDFDELLRFRSIQYMKF
jgi:hypothetical protein